MTRSSSARAVGAGAAVLALLCTPAVWAQASAQSKSTLARRAPPAPAVTLPVADIDQQTAAAMTHMGQYACEFNESVAVGKNQKFDGYVDVQHRRSIWIMKPVLSQTGALRLEDVKGRMLMLQIADKSMLMDVRAGQRVVDNCVHEKQREATAARKAAGDASASLGIDPAKAAAPDAAASSASRP